MTPREEADKFVQIAASEWATSGRPLSELLQAMKRFNDDVIALVASSEADPQIERVEGE